MIEVKLGELADEQLDMVAGGNGGTGGGLFTADGTRAHYRAGVDLVIYNSYSTTTLAENMSGQSPAGRGTGQHNG